MLWILFSNNYLNHSTKHSTILFNKTWAKFKVGIRPHFPTIKNTSQTLIFLEDIQFVELLTDDGTF